MRTDNLYAIGIKVFLFLRVCSAQSYLTREDE